MILRIPPSCKLLHLVEIFIRQLSTEQMWHILSWSTGAKNSSAATEQFLQRAQLKTFCISFLWASVSHTVKISMKNCTSSNRNRVQRENATKETGKTKRWSLNTVKQEAFLFLAFKRHHPWKKTLSLTFIVGLFTGCSQPWNEKHSYAIFLITILGILRHSIWILQEISHAGTPLVMQNIRPYNITLYNCTIDWLLKWVT